LKLINAFVGVMNGKRMAGILQTENKPFTDVIRAREIFAAVGYDSGVADIIKIVDIFATDAGHGVPWGNARRSNAGRRSGEVYSEILVGEVNLATPHFRLRDADLFPCRYASGTLFARVLGKEGVGEPLTAQTVMAVLRKVGRWIGLEREEWGGDFGAFRQGWGGAGFVGAEY
jgi:hypothetical protein